MVGRVHEIFADCLTEGLWDEFQFGKRLRAFNFFIEGTLAKFGVKFSKRLGIMRRISSIASPLSKCFRKSNRHNEISIRIQKARDMAVVSGRTVWMTFGDGFPTGSVQMVGGATNVGHHQSIGRVSRSGVRRSAVIQTISNGLHEELHAHQQRIMNEMGSLGTYPVPVSPVLDSSPNERQRHKMVTHSEICNCFRCRAEKYI